MQNNDGIGKNFTNSSTVHRHKARQCSLMLKANNIFYSNISLK